MSRFTVLMALTIFAADTALPTAGAGPYGFDLLDREGKANTGLGGLMVIDGHVFVANEPGQDLWYFHSVEGGQVIKLRGGPHSGYLTSDAEGRVFLTEKAEEGSYWETQCDGVPTFKTAFIARWRRDGHWVLTADEETSTYTDKAGRKYKVRKVRLTPKGSVFRGGLVAP